ncbi:MAG: hypothetical protein COB67_07135 [SAR324 cluster bacterium]|uniref:Branched-chain amino acid aminotransferase n=1 Tax=SAR324 cluster bacterium TaxID=2024889 RepID=A0A2A4T379_9DELT|nr:MAG: hypothetical protein COB67_07135 [SAR324 cluster bacterium]
MIVLLNNQWVKKEDAQVSLFSEGLMFGLGVFETLRTYGDKELPFLEEHLQRLFTALEKLPIPCAYSREQVEIMVRKVAGKAPQTLQRIKILVIPEVVMVCSVPLNIPPEIYQGVTLKSIVCQRSLPEIKSTSYLDCYLSHQEAQAGGYYDALLVDEQGQVYEGSKTNIFWFEEDILVTRRDSVLPGVMRKIILEKFPFQTEFKSITVSKLVKQQEVFVSNSIIGIAPIIAINGQELNNGRPGPRTEEAICYWRHLSCGG